MEIINVHPVFGQYARRLRAQRCHINSKVGFSLNKHRVGLVVYLVLTSDVTYLSYKQSTFPLCKAKQKFYNCFRV